MKEVESQDTQNATSNAYSVEELHHAIEDHEITRDRSSHNEFILEALSPYEELLKKHLSQWPDLLSPQECFSQIIKKHKNEVANIKESIAEIDFAYFELKYHLAKAAEKFACIQNRTEFITSDVYTNSFPGIEIVSESGESRFVSFGALLQAAADIDTLNQEFLKSVKSHNPDLYSDAAGEHYLRPTAGCVLRSLFKIKLESETENEAKVNLKLDPGRIFRIYESDNDPKNTVPNRFNLLIDCADYHVHSTDLECDGIENKKEYIERIYIEVVMQRHNGDVSKFSFDDCSLKVRGTSIFKNISDKNDLSIEYLCDYYYSYLMQLGLIEYGFKVTDAEKYFKEKVFPGHSSKLSRNLKNTYLPLISYTLEDYSLNDEGIFIPIENKDVYPRSYHVLESLNEVSPLLKSQEETFENVEDLKILETYLLKAITECINKFNNGDIYSTWTHSFEDIGFTSNDGRFIYPTFAELLQTLGNTQYNLRLRDPEQKDHLLEPTPARTLREFFRNELIKNPSSNEELYLRAEHCISVGLSPLTSNNKQRNYEVGDYHIIELDYQPYRKQSNDRSFRKKRLENIFKELLFQRYGNNLEKFSFAEMINSKIILDTATSKKVHVKELVTSYVNLLVSFHVQEMNKEAQQATAEFYFKTLLTGKLPPNVVITSHIKLEEMKTGRLTTQTVNALLGDIVYEQFGRINENDIYKLKGKYIVSTDGEIVLSFDSLLKYSKAFELLSTPPQISTNRGNSSVYLFTPTKVKMPIESIKLIQQYENILGIKKGCFSYPTDPIQYNPHDEFEKIHEAIKIIAKNPIVEWQLPITYKQFRILLSAYHKAIQEVIDANNETVENTKTYSYSNQAYTDHNGEVIFSSFLDLLHATARVHSAARTLKDTSEKYSVHPGDVLAYIQANTDIYYNSQYNLKSIPDVSDDGNSMQVLNLASSFSKNEIENALKELISQMQLNENNIFFSINRSPRLQEVKIPTYYLLIELQKHYSVNANSTIKYINHDEDEKVFDRVNCITLNCLKTEYYLRSTVFSQTPPSLTVQTVNTEDVILAEKVNSTKVREIIKKICLECYGEYSYDTVLKLQGSFVLNEDEGVITHGSILVKRAYSSKNDMGEPIFATKIKEPKIISETKAEKYDRTLETIRSVVKDTTVPEGILLHALSTLGFISATPRAFETIHERIIKANKPVSEKSTQKKPTEIFEEVTALAGQKIDFTEAGVLRLSDLLKQLCLRVHNGDVEKVISELNEYVEGSHKKSSNLPEKLQSLIIEKVIPTLINLFKDIDDFTHPLTVQTKLYPLQVEAVIEALEYQKPIKVMGTGTGKTETAAVYCESLIESQKSSAVLWVTKSSSRVGACERILEKILKPELSFKVSVLGPKEISLDQSSFESFLDGNRYVIVGADSLHKLKKENPENFQTLQNWLKDKIRILDEFHILDKKTSKRSMAVRELESKFTLSASATPFQHDESRIATILHTNFPDTYPSIQELTLTFKRHPHLAEELLRAHSTIFQLEDLAIPFEDPSKISFKEQLMGGLPRIPTTSRKIHEVQLSRKQTEVYIDAATNYQQFIEQNEGLSNNSQVDILRKIIGNPESVGAGAPFALIEGIKSQALPFLREGKKVFIAAENTALLTWLAADSELKMYGSQLLDGKMTPEERHPEIVRFEEDSAFQCLIGQVDAVGSSDNFRSTDLLVIVQPPKTIAGGIQLEGRVTRAIAQGEERFVRCTVEILYIVPTLDPEVIKLVPEAHRRKVLKRGTVYDLWTKRFIARLERYKLFTSRKSSASSSQHNSTQEILSALAKTYGEIVSSQSKFELISADSVREKVSQYNTAAKKTWRDDFLRKNILQHLEFIGKEPKDIKVALLPGPEGLELYTYLTLGVLPENIYCFEASKDEKILNMTRENVIREGCRFYSTKIETMLPQLDVPFDIISIDPNGYITPEMVTMFLKLPVNSHSLISMNTLGQREKGDSINLLNFFGGIRGNLQKALLKLIATEGKHPTKNWDGKNALLLASQVRCAARVLGSIFESEYNFDKKSMTELLGELYFGSMHLQSIDQYSYIGKGGSRFHSTFAALSPWDIDLRESDASNSLRSIMHDIVCVGINRQKRVRPSEIKVNRISDSIITLSIGDTLIGKVDKSELSALLKYFASVVRNEHLLHELIATSDLSLKLDKL